MRVPLVRAACYLRSRPLREELRMFISSRSFTRISVGAFFEIDVRDEEL